MIYAFSHQNLRVLQVAPVQRVVQVHVFGAKEKTMLVVMLIEEQIEQTCAIATIQTR